MSKPKTPRLAAAFLFLAAAACAQAVPTTGTVAFVNGNPISRAELDAHLAEARVNGAPPSSQIEQDVLMRVCRERALSIFAMKQGFFDRPEIKFELDTLRRRHVISKMAADYINQHYINDDELRRVYDERRRAYGKREYLVRHILVKDEETAEALISRIQGGEKFEAVAQSESSDSNATEGGLLPWSSPSAFPSDFAAAATSLEPGQMRGIPLKTEFGWHIIKLEDRRNATSYPSFEQSREKLRREAEQALVKKHFDGVIAAARIEILPSASDADEKDRPQSKPQSSRKRR